MNKFEQWFIQQFFFSEEQFNEFFQLENGKYIAKLQDQNVIAYTFRLNNLKLSWDAQQSKIEQLEKELAQMKHINDEQNKNLEAAFKTIHIQQKFDVDSRGTIACLTEMNQRYLGKMQEQQDQIAELKDNLFTHKVENYEMSGRISYAHHCFVSMSRDHFYKNIEAIICGRLRHPEFSFDKTRIKALRGECE